MNRPIRVLFFLNKLSLGGKERRVVELMREFARRKNVECEIALMSKDVHYQEVFSLGFKIHYLLRTSRKDVTIPVGLYAICKLFKPDIIHVWDSMAAVYAIPVCMLTRCKLFNSMITDAPDLLGPFSQAWLRAKVIFPFSDIVTSNSKAGLKAYRAPSDRSVCIYNGLDMHRAEGVQPGNEIKAKYGLLPGKKIVGMVAEFAPRKDYATFLNAAREILAVRSDVLFLSVGDGADLEKNKAMVNAADGIRFLGRQADVESLVNIFDIGVLTTNARIHGEGISNSILEYMAFGKPVVASIVGGTAELVEDSTTGFLIPPFDGKVLKEKLLYLLDHPESSKAMGERGRKKVSNEFSLEKMVNSFFERYMALLNRSTVPSKA